MTEQELRRTAVIIPPTGRAVPLRLGGGAGAVRCALRVLAERRRRSGFLPALGLSGLLPLGAGLQLRRRAGERTVTVYSGVALPVRQVLPRRAVTSVRLLRTPLLRLGGVSLLIVAAPGAKLLLPAIPAQQAGLLAHILAEDAP